MQAAVYPYTKEGYWYYWPCGSRQATVVCSSVEGSGKCTVCSVAVWTIGAPIGTQQQTCSTLFNIWGTYLYLSPLAVYFFSFHYENTPINGWFGVENPHYKSVGYDATNGDEGACDSQPCFCSCPQSRWVSLATQLWSPWVGWADQPWFLPHPPPPQVCVVTFSGNGSSLAV